MSLRNLVLHSKLTAVALFALSLCAATAAHAVTFHNFSWEGQVAGVSARGRFSYDETNLPSDGVIRQANLLSFDVSFYDPANNLLRTYTDNHLNYSGFNFNFDTATRRILQDGGYSAANGIDIGDYQRLSANLVRGLNLWSGPGHLHFDDWNNEFNLPRAFGGHRDVAFFNATTQRLVDSGRVGSSYAANPNFALDAVGARVSVEPVPLPASMGFLLSGLGLFGAVARRRA